MIPVTHEKSCNACENISLAFGFLSADGATGSSRPPWKMTIAETFRSYCAAAKEISNHGGFEQMPHNSVQPLTEENSCEVSTPPVNAAFWGRNDHRWVPVRVVLMVFVP